MAFNTSLRDQILLYIKENPGLCRTEIRDRLGCQNNVSGPAIKELIDRGMVVEGPDKISLTTGKPGKSLYLAEEWKHVLDVSWRLFEDF